MALRSADAGCKPLPAVRLSGWPEAAVIGRYNLPKVLANLEALVQAMGPARMNVHTGDCTSIDDLRQTLARREVPAACAGCRKLNGPLTEGATGANAGGADGPGQ